MPAFKAKRAARTTKTKGAKPLPNGVRLMSDSAVKQATGRGWSAWFRLLDKAGAKKMNHQQIVACLGEHEIPDWWHQMVTVSYEQARGLRAKHETPDGYQISGSKTVNVPIGELFSAWHDARRRAQWIHDPRFTVRRATRNKSMRITWVDGATSVEANFYTKGAAKSQVALSHRKLPDAKAAAKMKAYWARQLAKLKAMLET